MLRDPADRLEPSISVGPGKVIVQAVAHDDTGFRVTREIHALTDDQLLGEARIRDAAGVC